MVNKKSDVKAKDAFIAYLNNAGYNNAKVISKPCDISAEKDGKKWYFEIKMTSKQDVYFGAATMTEWEQAFKTPEFFRFVIAITDESQECGFRFIKLTPEEMMEHSTIPPFKVYFNIDLQNKEDDKIEKSEKNKKAKRKKSAIKLTESIFNMLADAFKKANEK